MRSLDNFLQVGFRIHMESSLKDCRKCGNDMLMNEGLCCLKPSVEIYSSQKGFKRVCEDIWVLIPPSLSLPLGEQYNILKSNSERDIRQVSSAYECGTNVRQLSFAMLWEFSKQKFSGYQLQDRIS